MRQAQEIGEAQLGWAEAAPPRRAGQRREFRVGGRQEQDVARALPEVHRFRALRDRPALGGQKMQGALLRRRLHGARRQPRDGVADRGLVFLDRIVQADHDEPGRPRLAGGEGAVVIAVDPPAHGLD